MTKTFGRGTAQPGITGRGGGRSTSRRTRSPKKRVKQENLEDNGHLDTPIVSPSQSVKIKKEKLEKTNYFGAARSNDLISEIDLTDDEIPPVEDAVKAFKGITNGKFKLDDEVLKTYMKSWAIQNPQELNVEEINGMDHQTIIDTISDVTALIMDNESSGDELQKEVDEEINTIFEVVKEMDICSTTTNEQLLDYTPYQRSLFVYWAYMHVESDMTLENILSQPEAKTLNKLKVWRDNRTSTAQESITQTSSSENDDDLYGNDPKETTTEHRKPSPQPMEIDQETQSNHIQKKILHLDGDLSDVAIKSMNMNSLRLVYSNYMAGIGSPIASEDLNRLQPQVLRSKITTCRDEIFKIKQGNCKVTSQPMEVDSTPKPIPTLDSNLSDHDIKNMDIDTLRSVYSTYMKKAGSPIAVEILQLWKPNLLRSNITMHRNQARGSEKTQTSPEISNNNATKGSLKKDLKYSSNPIQAKLDMTTFQSVRYDMSFLLPVEFKGTEGLRSHFSNIFQTFQGYCEGLQLRPWDDQKAQMETIDTIDDLPSTITQIKKYLFNARAPTPGSRSYFSIHLSFPIRTNRTTFDADVSAWAQAQNIRFNECSVQHADVRSVGWLAYAPSSLHAKKWCKAVQELFQIYYKKKNMEPLMLGLTWRPMNGQYGIESKKKVFSMHVNAPRNKGALTKKFLRLLAYNKKWPLGLRFRLVDEYHEFMSEPTKIKYRYMFDRHRTFIKEMKQISNDQVINLDKPIGESKMTVRDVVNNIRDASDNKRIFASFDPKWNDPSVHIAVFRPDKSSKAGGFIKNLSAYVAHLYPSASLNRIFNIEAITLAEETEYDPKTQTFLTQEQKDFDAEIQADLDDDSFEFLIPDADPDYIAVDMDNIKLLGGEKLYNLTGDDDTASTHPASSSMISFSSNSIHHYDTESCADGSDPNHSKLSSQDILQRINAHHQRTLEKKASSKDKANTSNVTNASISNAITDQLALLNQSSHTPQSSSQPNTAAYDESNKTNSHKAAAGA